MKKLIIISSCLILLRGCGTSPNFSKENTIQWKTVGESGRARYELKGVSIDSLFGFWEFYAPQDFARVGDIIVMKDGVTTVQRGEK